MSTVASANTTAKPKVELKPDPVNASEAPRSCLTFESLGNALGFGLLSTLFPLCTQRGQTTEEDHSGARDASRRFGI